MNSDNSKENPASFAELTNREVVEARDLVDSLVDYALNGWAINGSVVVEIMQRTHLSPQALQHIGLLSYEGVERQMAGGRYNSSTSSGYLEAKQYAMVGIYAETQLLLIAQSN